jgi:hypothetical protein
MPEQGGAESPPALLVARDEQPAVAIGHVIWQAVEPAHVAAGLLESVDPSANLKLVDGGLIAIS